MSRLRFNELVERARQRGYPVDKLIVAAPLL
jgi:lipocalin